MYRHILVPIDDSDLSMDTVNKAAEFAQEIGARITFCHARPDLGATDGGTPGRTMVSAEYSDPTAADARVLLAKAEAAAHAAGMAHDSVATISDRPYEEIIDTASEQGCDLIFMACCGKRDQKGLIIDSKTQKVLAHTTIPVLLSTIESNLLGDKSHQTEATASAPGDQRSFSAIVNAAVTVIEGEHRSLAAALRGLKHALRQAKENGKAADIALLRAIIQYFRRFPEALHHPKEEEYLFARLRARAPDAVGFLANLTQQHSEESGMIDAIEKAVDAYGSKPDATCLDRLIAETDRYARRLWDHMSAEENCILPACRMHFTADDWREVTRAFIQNGDPRFDRDKEASFEKLFARIMSMADKPAQKNGRTA